MNSNNCSKKHVKFGPMILALCVISAIASPLIADMTVKMNGYGALRQGSGGEFTFRAGAGWQSDPLDLYNSKATHNGGFQTFCLEKNEYIWQNSTYDVKFSQSAKNGGNNYADNATSGQDNISNGTAWLYGHFAAGTLAGYNYDISDENAILARKISGQSLQKAFWTLEDEEAVDNNNMFIKLLTESGQFASLIQAKLDYLGNEVGVMNLTRNGNKAQDQLAMSPTPVPAPGAFTLAGIGAAIAGYRRRKRLA